MEFRPVEIILDKRQDGDKSSFNLLQADLQYKWIGDGLTSSVEHVKTVDGITTYRRYTTRSAFILSSYKISGRTALNDSNEEAPVDKNVYKTHSFIDFLLEVEPSLYKIMYLERLYKNFNEIPYDEIRVGILTRQGVEKLVKLVPDRIEYSQLLKALDYESKVAEKVNGMNVLDATILISND